MISNWVRQSRYRAKKYNVINDLTVEDIIGILNDKCTYCQHNNYKYLDHPFPLKDNAPNVQANVAFICERCRTIKKNDNIISMNANNYISNDEYIKLLAKLFVRRGGIYIRDYVRKLSGLE